MSALPPLQERGTELAPVAAPESGARVVGATGVLQPITSKVEWADSVPEGQPTVKLRTNHS